MNVAQIVKLIEVLAPPAQAAVGAVVQAFHGKDPAQVRAAVEAALVLQFEARQLVRKP